MKIIHSSSLQVRRLIWFTPRKHEPYYLEHLVRNSYGGFLLKVEPKELEEVLVPIQDAAEHRVNRISRNCVHCHQHSAIPSEEMDRTVNDIVIGLRSRFDLG